MMSRVNDIRAEDEAERVQKHRFSTAGMRRHKRIYVRTDRLLQCAQGGLS